MCFVNHMYKHCAYLCAALLCVCPCHQRDVPKHLWIMVSATKTVNGITSNVKTTPQGDTRAMGDSAWKWDWNSVKLAECWVEWNRKAVTGCMLQEYGWHIHHKESLIHDCSKSTIYWYTYLTYCIRRINDSTTTWSGSDFNKNALQCINKVFEKQPGTA